MKVIKKNVYYCAFCKKKSLKSLKGHEKHCTGNLDRECKLCKCDYNYRKIVEGLKARFSFKEIPIKILLNINEPDFYCTKEIIWNGEPITAEEISDLVEGCPICMLTIIKNLTLDNYERLLLQIKFDYKNELGNYWNERNSIEREREEYSAMYL
jgi:hypothetical protein